MKCDCGDNWSCPICDKDWYYIWRKVRYAMPMWFREWMARRYFSRDTEWLHRNNISTNEFIVTMHRGYDRAKSRWGIDLRVCDASCDHRK